MPCAIWKNLLVYTSSSLGQSLPFHRFQTVYKTIETVLEYNKCLTILAVPVDAVSCPWSCKACPDTTIMHTL